jgi:hypothetical protein
VNPAIPSPGVPAQLAYYNFYSNLTLNFEVNFSFFTLNTGSFDAGDLVMLPGSANPRAEPADGGEMFLPGGAQTTNRHEFAMNDQLSIDPYADALFPPLAAADIKRILASPVTHFNLPSDDNLVKVAGCGAGSAAVTVAAEVATLLKNPTHGCA